MSTTNPTRITSEWDDIQVKFGNYVPLPTEETEEEKTLNLIEQSERLVQISEEAIRAKRLEKLKKRHNSRKYGSPIDVYSDDFVENVTNYSKEAPVIVFLYDQTGRTFQALKGGYEILARRFPDTKFAIGEAKRIVSSSGRTAPSALLVYKGGACVAQAGAAQVIAMQGSHLADRSIEERAAEAILDFIVRSGVELSRGNVLDSDSDASDSGIGRAVFGAAERDSDDSRSDEEYERKKSRAYTSNLLNRVLNNRV